MNEYRALRGDHKEINCETFWYYHHAVLSKLFIIHKTANSCTDSPLQSAIYFLIATVKTNDKGKQNR